MVNLVYGIHAVTSVLEKSPEQVVELLLQRHYEKNRKLVSLFSRAESLHIPIQIVDKVKLDGYQSGANHQGVICKMQQAPRIYHEQDLAELLASSPSPRLVLILDQIQDPHNLGSCLRSAAAAGVCVVIAPKDGSVSLTPVVQKVACGGAQVVPFVQVTNLARTMRQLQEQGIWLTGTAADAPNTLYDIDFKGDIGIVIGGEGKGLRRLIREQCDFLAKIPMPGQMESLNAAVATGVCLFEVVRQRHERHC